MQKNKKKKHNFSLKPKMVSYSAGYSVTNMADFEHIFSKPC